MYNEILNTFVEENKTRLPRLEKSKEENDMKNYAIDMHAMKSDSKYLGFTKLAELSLEHELKAKANESKYVEEHYEDLIKELNRICNIIEKYL